MPAAMTHPATTRRTAKAPLRTLPEQIADELGGDIANGVIRPGERLREINIAERYGVSRAPVREAIRVLARRGLVDFYPRRGAFAIELTIDRLVDTFNVMAHLNGLATRYFALLAETEAVARLGSIVTSLEDLAEDPDCDPQEFGLAAARVGAFITRNCGSPQVASLLHHQLNNSLWNSVWRRPIDFFTPERRREAAGLARLRYAAILDHDADRADQISREMTYLARDHAIAAFSRVRDISAG
jgi:DNA-binding GntR family transcriptional regulator